MLSAYRNYTSCSTENVESIKTSMEYVGTYGVFVLAAFGILIEVSKIHVLQYKYDLKLFLSPHCKLKIIATVGFRSIDKSLNSLFYFDHSIFIRTRQFVQDTCTRACQKYSQSCSLLNGFFVVVYISRKIIWCYCDLPSLLC